MSRRIVNEHGNCIRYMTRMSRKNIHTLIFPEMEEELEEEELEEEEKIPLLPRRQLLSEFTEIELGIEIDQASTLLDNNVSEIKKEIFNIKCEKKLSLIAKLILQSAKLKNFYYVYDDINYGLKSIPFERNFLLQSLSSIAIFMQNNLFLNFFDIWLGETYIKEVPVHNKFINDKYQNLNPEEYITIEVYYTIYKKERPLRFIEKLALLL